MTALQGPDLQRLLRGFYETVYNKFTIIRSNLCKSGPRIIAHTLYYVAARVLRLSRSDARSLAVTEEPRDA